MADQEISELQFVAGEMQEDIDVLIELILSGTLPDYPTYKEMSAKYNALVSCQNHLLDRDRDLRRG